MAQIHTFDCNGLEISTEKEKRGGHCQKLYADLYGSKLTTPNEQLIANVRGYVEHWVLQDLPVAEPQVH